MWAKHKQHGFTIVELLIVIVVIGILAAVTIVAYNGIQGRAQAAAVSSALEQTSKKLSLYMVDNAAYPPDLATAGINNTGGTSYQYSVNNAVSPQTYCVTATDGSTSYKASSMAPAPTSGGCPGHGVGGVGAVTNLAINPSAATNATYWSNNIGGTTLTRDSLTTRPGSLSSGSIETTFSVGSTASTQLWDGTTTPEVPVTPGDIITISAWVKSSVTGRILQIGDRWRDSSNVQLSVSNGPNITTSTSWTQVSFTAQTPVGTAFDHISFYFAGTSGDSWWLDDVMVTKGSTAYNYGDGNSANWVWNGTPNNSTSTGPAL